MTHAEFRKYLYDELRRERPSWTEDECRETAELTASSVPDNERARASFLEGYRSYLDKQEK